MARRYDSSTTTFSPEGAFFASFNLSACMIVACVFPLPSIIMPRSTSQPLPPHLCLESTVTVQTTPPLAPRLMLPFARLSLTSFSPTPKGRLHQVEYAIEAINNAGTCVGILCADGIVLAAERKTTSKLLAPSKSSDKIYQIDGHIACVVAGLTSDANILINQGAESQEEKRGNIRARVNP